VRFLILGGGDFVGRALVDAAINAGHQVTTLTQSSQPAGAVALHGDRTTASGLAVLDDGEWDAVIDTWSGAPRVVRLSVEALRGRAGFYAYVSSLSVYADPFPFGGDESAPVVDADPDADATEYPADKRGGELAVLSGFGEQQSMLARAGVIVGPYENTGRLVWWLRRISLGGEVLAPGPRDMAMEYIDVRDLAEWMVACAQVGTPGAFNAVSPPAFTTFGELLEECVRQTGSDARLVWVTPEFLAEQGIGAWTELPFWLPPAEAQPHYSADTSAAAAAGLFCRPPAQTVADTWAWVQAGGVARPKAGRPPAGLAAAKERAALAAWRKRSD
jgi:2'-hydroxyisoflavone reductase